MNRSPVVLCLILHKAAGRDLQNGDIDVNLHVTAGTAVGRELVQSAIAGVQVHHIAVARDGEGRRTRVQLHEGTVATAVKAVNSAHSPASTICMQVHHIAVACDVVAGHAGDQVARNCCHCGGR